MKLKIYFYITFLALFFRSCFSVVGSGGNIFGQTHFSDIPEFLAGGPIRIDFMSSLLRDAERKKIGINLVYVSSYSTNSNKIAQFFTPYGDLLLSTTGGNDYFVPGPLPSSNLLPTNKVVRDVDAQILGIKNDDFASLTSFYPLSNIKYIGFFGFYNFSFNDDNSPRWSLLCALPIVSCFHKMTADETIYRGGKNDDKNSVYSVLTGLNREALDFQRWNTSCEGMEKLSIPSIEFDLNYIYLLNNQCAIESYLGCLIPLKNNLKNSPDWEQYIFSPQMINANHFGLQYGITVDLMLYENYERSIKFVFGNNLLYYFPSTENRSFDLLQRPWSRYLYTYRDYGLLSQQLEPLVNFLTLSCRVTPNFSNIATSEFHYLRKKLLLAAGYSLFARQSESVTILDDIPNIVLQGSNNAITFCNPVSICRTAALRLPYEDVQVKEIDMISEESIFNTNYFYAKIDNTKIDISSATHPAVFCGELYIKGKYQFCYIGNIIAGCSYKFSHTNTAIEYATAWIGFEGLF